LRTAPHLNEVDPASKERLHRRQKAQVRVGAIGVRHVLEFDEKIDVARALVEVTASC
jgi:hypothetical protein